MIASRLDTGFSLLDSLPYAVFVRGCVTLLVSEPAIGELSFSLSLMNRMTGVSCSSASFISSKMKRAELVDRFLHQNNEYADSRSMQRFWEMEDRAILPRTAKIEKGVVDFSFLDDPAFPDVIEAIGREAADIIFIDCPRLSFSESETAALCRKAAGQGSAIAMLKQIPRGAGLSFIGIAPIAATLLLERDRKNEPEKLSISVFPAIDPDRLQLHLDPVTLEVSESHL